MRIDDAIYGSFKIKGIIGELVASAPFQRLKDVHQGGAIFLVDPSQRHTRYDHSLGVYWLVTHFGGNLAQRVAALLHDISHTAFSHVADYLFDRAGEDYHELIFEELVNNSEIPGILRQYGLDNALNDYSDFKILERPLPELCADRLDYTLRDLYHSGNISLTEIQEVLESITVSGDQMKITDPKMARWMMDRYEQLNEAYFRRPEYLFANQQLENILRRAIASRAIVAHDLLATDTQVLSKLRALGYAEALDDITKLVGFERFDIVSAASKVKKRSLSLLD